MSHYQNQYLKLQILSACAHKNTDKANRLSKLLHGLTGEVLVNGEWVKV